MFGRKYPEKITSQITATICGTPLSNSIESHSDRSKAPEEFTNHKTSPETPLDFSYSSLSGKFKISFDSSHKANSAAKMQTNFSEAAKAHPEFRSSVNPIQTKGADYAHHITACPPRFENRTASLNLQSVRQSRSDLLCRPVVAGGAGGAMAPPDFARSVTLSQPGGADYAHQNTTGTSGFSDLPTALLCDNSLGQPSSNIISSNSNDDPEDMSTSIISLDINLEGKFQKWCQNLCKSLTRFDCLTLDESKFYLKR